MANIKQQIKRNKTNEKSRLRNAAFKSSVRTAVKNVELAVAASDKEKALNSLPLAHKKLDKAHAKGIFHKNYVARHKAYLANLINNM